MLPASRLLLSALNGRFIQNINYSIKIGNKPLGSIFFHPKIQFLMKKLTTVDYEKIFELRKLEKGFTKPAVYTFMTDEELKEERKKVEKKAETLLQMPPLVDVTENKTETLSNDSCLDGHDDHHSEIVFTDISSDIEPQERVIVVRQANGLLRTANKNERHRMNQLFFPVNGRELHKPKMFEPEYLQKILARGDYEFILNRACIQFQPEDEDYHNVLIATFDYVNDKGDFDKLIKTRHFGPFALYLAVNNKINNMLQFFLESERLMEASFLVNIHRIVHTVSPWSLSDVKHEDSEVNSLLSFDTACETVKDFISDSTNKASKLESCFYSLVQKIKEQEEWKRKTLQAHGA